MAPIVFAHRGASGYEPGNTLAAFELALQQGAAGLETDAWLASDGVPVLVHDRERRRWLRRVDVTRVSSERLAGHGVLRLSDLYERCGTAFELSVDLRHAEVAPALVAGAVAAGAAERLYVCAGSPTRLGCLRTTSSAPQLVCSTRSRPQPGWLPELLTILGPLGIGVVNLRCDEWRAELVDRVHDAGMRAFGWDAHSDERVRRLAELGIDGLYSNYPDRALAVVAGRS